MLFSVNPAERHPPVLTVKLQSSVTGLERTVRKSLRPLSVFNRHSVKIFDRLQLPDSSPRLPTLDFKE